MEVPGKKEIRTCSFNAFWASFTGKGLKLNPSIFGGKPLRGCTACVKCVEKKNKQCVLPDDGLNDYVAKMEQAEGIILAKEGGNAMRFAILIRIGRFYGKREEDG